MALLEVKQAIEKTVAKSRELYRLGFKCRFVDRLFWAGRGEFGKYEKVEKADGSEVTVAICRNGS